MRQAARLPGRRPTQGLTYVVFALGWAVAARAAPFAYVTNIEGHVSVIDTATDTVTATIPIGGSCDIAVHPDGTRAYATTDNGVVVIDTANNSVVTTVPVVPMRSAAGIAVAPDGAHVYVVNYTDPGGLTTIDSATLSVVGSVRFQPASESWAGERYSRKVAVSPDGERAWVTNTYDTFEPHGCSGNPDECPLTVAIVDLATNEEVGVATDVGAHLGGIAASPWGDRAYVASQTEQLWGRYIGPFGVTVVGLFGGAGHIPFNYALDVAVDPSGALVYATSEPLRAVVVIDAKTNAVIAQVPAGFSPRALAVNRDGTRVYVTNYPTNTVDLGTVWVIDTTTNSSHQAATVGYLPCGIAIGPDVIGTLTPTPFGRFTPTPTPTLATYCGTCDEYTGWCDVRLGSGASIPGHCDPAQNCLCVPDPTGTPTPVTPSPTGPTRTPTPTRTLIPTFGSCGTVCDERPCPVRFPSDIIRGNCTLQADNQCTCALPQRCPGDCDGDGGVTVDELVRGVTIALKGLSVARCYSLDTDASGTVTVEELVAAVNNALDGCSVTSTPTATPTPSATATEIVSGCCALTAQCFTILSAADFPRCIVGEHGAFLPDPYVCDAGSSACVEKTPTPSSTPTLVHPCGEVCDARSCGDENFNAVCSSSGQLGRGFCSLQRPGRCECVGVCPATPTHTRAPVSSAADLIVTDVSIAPPPSGSCVSDLGEVPRLRVCVRNQGEGAAGAFSVALNGEGVWRVDGLDSMSTMCLFGAFVAAGSVTVDANHEIPEADESDNAFSFSLFEPTPPLTCVPTRTRTPTVREICAGTCSPTASPTKTPTDACRGGAMCTPTITPTRSETPTRTFTAMPADLLPGDISIAPPPHSCISAIGEVPRLRVCVRNQGGITTGAFSLFVNGQLFARVDAVGPGGQPCVDGSFVQAGMVVVDAAGEVPETDETNNAASFALPIPTAPRFCTPTPPGPPTLSPTATRTA
jgi:YVTN family beta-propeller protein